MRDLVQHQWWASRHSMVGNSFLNCHVHGLHSIVICQSPTIRVYITDQQHQLYRNLPEHTISDPQSVAFHPHHCDITLSVWRGAILNWRMELSPFMSGRFVNKFRYENAALGCGTTFTKLGETFLTEVGQDLMDQGDVEHLRSGDLHTIGVNSGAVVAWFVFTGQENSAYEPLAYSNADLTRFDPAGLYIRPTEERVRELLESVDLL